MADREHLLTLKDGADVWNEWRKNHPDAKPDLSNVLLTGAQLSRANLSDANFTNTNLAGASLDDAILINADLSRAVLNGASLTGTNLCSASLTGAELTGVDLSGADLSGAKLEESDLSGAKLENADLNGAYLTDANFSNANFAGANLVNALVSAAKLNGANLNGAMLNGADFSGADLTGAHLSHADLTGALLTHANLSDANLRDAKSFRLDDTFVRSTSFDAKSKDPWSVLRRKYTGPMFLFHVIFLMVFLGVYMARAMIWVGVNLAQESLEIAQGSLEIAQQEIILQTNVAATMNAQALSDLQEDVRKLWEERDLDQDALQAVTEVIAASITPSGVQPAADETNRLVKTINYITPCLQPECQPKQPVWRVLLRLEDGPIASGLAVALIVYNLLRWWLTSSVGLLRDAEERSGYSPRYADYKWPYMAHTFVMWPLFMVAIAALLYNGYLVLFQTTVILPA